MFVDEENKSKVQLCLSTVYVQVYLEAVFYFVPMIHAGRLHQHSCLTMPGFSESAERGVG